jgi:hypothetical protein
VGVVGGMVSGQSSCMDNLCIASSDEDGTIPVPNVSYGATPSSALRGRKSDGHTEAFSGDWSRIESGGTDAGNSCRFGRR